MSTSEQTLVPGASPEAASVPAGLPGTGITPGVLSPAELTRMANEMFNALPGELQQPALAAARVVLPSNSAFTGNPYAAVPSPTAPAVPGLASGLFEPLPASFVSAPDHGAAPDPRSWFEDQLHAGRGVAG